MASRRSVLAWAAGGPSADAASAGGGGSGPTQTGAGEGITQSPNKRLLPLALGTFPGQYSVNIPAVLASVVLTTLPILYIVGRRQRLSGLTAGFRK